MIGPIVYYTAWTVIIVQVELPWWGYFTFAGAVPPLIIGSRWNPPWDVDPPLQGAWPKVAGCAIQR